MMLRSLADRAALKSRCVEETASGDAGEIVQTPDFGVASEPVSVLGGTADSDSTDELEMCIRDRYSIIVR